MSFSNLMLGIFLACFITLGVIAFTQGKLWGILIAGILGLVGIIEIISYCISGRTISQKYSKWRKEHPVLGWVTKGLLIIGVLALIAHLG